MNEIIFDTIDSTNKFVKENYASLDDFSFVSAKEQTNGKGRLDRSWNSTKGENLLFSFIIKNPKLVNKFKALSVGTATLIARFLQLKGIDNIKVKWPNDVYVNDKKICGILLEGKLPEFIIVGVGLNVNQTKFDGEYRKTPTSVAIELKKEINLDEFKTELFAFLAKHIKQNRFVKKSLSFARENDYLLGKEVTYNNITGIANGISDDFGLIVDDKIIYSGEISNI